MKTIFNKKLWVVIVAVFTLLGYLAYPAMQRAYYGIALGEYNCEESADERLFGSGPYYNGPLIDSHIHMPAASKIVSFVAIKAGFEDLPHQGTVTVDDVACLLENEGVSNAFVFNLMPKFTSRVSLNRVKFAAGRHPDALVHFYMPTQLPYLNPNPAMVEKLLKKNPGLFRGYGEVKFDFTEIGNENILDPFYLESYLLAEKYGLVIMMHPSPTQEEEVRTLLEKHPTVKFLFHGGEIHEWIASVLRDHKNAYYSLDANISRMYGWLEEHGERGPTKEAYLAYMEDNFNDVLERELLNWKSAIEQNPDQYMWGTDRWYTWHFDPEVGKVLEDLGRSFIGRLHPGAQEKFAHENADELISR